MINQLEQKVINVEQENIEVLMVAKAKREHQRTPESTFAACWQLTIQGEQLNSIDLSLL